MSLSPYLKTESFQVSETLSFLVFQESTSPSPRLKTESDDISETLCFLVLKIPDDGENSRNPTTCVIHSRQNPLDYAKTSNTYEIFKNTRIS
jgi:hypothetical protein